MDQQTDKKRKTDTTFPEPYLIDNHRHKLVDYLRAKLNKAKVFRVVSAYFTVYGYEALKEQLKKVERVRFLYGEPNSADTSNPNDNDYKAYWIHEEHLTPRQTLQQKQLVKECRKWLKKSNVEVRSVIRSNFLHGKMYVSETADGNGDSAVVGSSNFTGSGLGSTANPNLEINVANTDKPEINQLKNWFDELWNDDTQTKDVKKEILEALGQLGKDQTPETVYYKTLYEVFKDDLERLREGDTQPSHLKRLDHTEIWKHLYTFQKDGYLSVVNRLEQLNGCILADSVGLGKTYTALAVIKHFELKDNANVLVLCPKKLENNWKRYSRNFERKANPFAKDLFRYHVLAHTDLSRDKGMAGSIDLANFDWSSFNLVVIDESHNFRNATSSKKDEDGKTVRYSRYERLLKKVINEGGNTKVLMLSATPVNITLHDLRNQLYLMTERSPYALSEPLGIPDYEAVLKRAQNNFEKYQDHHHDKRLMIEALGGDLFRLINGVSIARSRRQIKELYEKDLENIGQFPEAQRAETRTPPTDIKGELSYDDLNEEISQMSLSLYSPSEFLLSNGRHTPSDDRQDANSSSNLELKRRQRSEINHMGMMRVNLLKRLESSVDSFVKTLERILDTVEKRERVIAKFEETGDPSITVTSELYEDDEDEEFEVNGDSSSYRLKDLDVGRYKTRLADDKRHLNLVLTRARNVTPERDGKLKALRQDIRNRAAMTTVDKDGNESRKMLVFTTFADTGKYLYENLKDFATNLGLNIAFVWGSGVKTPVGDKKFDDVLDNFAPIARGRSTKSQLPEIDLLIATDCISEGQNLQDCELVVNYDIHWNPVRLIQRFGRIDRIGSRHKQIRMINYWPTEDMERYLNLENRVKARMVLVDMAGTGDSNLLDKSKVEYDLKRRDEQLQLQFDGELPDPDAASGGLSFSDLSLEYFIHQLWNYLEHNRDRLEKIPNGIYAVVEDTAGQDEGVIFVLKHKNQRKTDAAKYSYSPVMPYYLIYISRAGEIKMGCTNTQDLLNRFNELTFDKKRVNEKLYRAFDAEIDGGRKLELYDWLLDKSVSHIQETFQRRSTQERGKRGFTMPKLSEQANSPDDFELITWLVVM